MKKLLLALIFMVSLSSFAKMDALNSDDLTTFKFSDHKAGPESIKKCQAELDTMLTKVKNAKKIIIKRSDCKDFTNDDGYASGVTGYITIFKY